MTITAEDESFDSLSFEQLLKGLRGMPAKDIRRMRYSIGWTAGLKINWVALVVDIETARDVARLELEDLRRRHIEGAAEVVIVDEHASAGHRIVELRRVWS